MTIGPAQDVLKDLRARVFDTESGAVLFTWSSAHGRRVAQIEEADEPTSGEAVLTGNEAPDYHQVGGLLPAKTSEKPQPQASAKPAANAFVKALADSWRSVFAPKESR